MDEEVAEARHGPGAGGEEGGGERSHELLPNAQDVTWSCPLSPCDEDGTRGDGTAAVARSFPKAADHRAMGLPRLHSSLSVI